MKNTIELLWNGTLSPCSDWGNNDSEIADLIILMQRNKESLAQTLSPQQMEAFEKYIDCIEEYTYLLSAHAFSDGFSLSAKLMTEALSVPIIFDKGARFMTYSNMIPGTFLSRPNRFISHVEIGGQAEVVHVKNTGRCRELLPAGAQVWCQKSDNPARKTKYDLITVRKGSRLINMDSQAPNAAAKEWLLSGGFGAVENPKAETFHGDSRFDFSFTLNGRQCFLEVKGVTLETDGVCAFPDAPTERGAKHLRGLTAAAREGYGAYVLFVIQMADVQYLHPNDATDPNFGRALREAAENGVQVMAMDCEVTMDSMTIRNPVPVRL